MSEQQLSPALIDLEYKAGELRVFIANLQADLAALERTMEVVDRAPDYDYEPIPRNADPSNPGGRDEG